MHQLFVLFTTCALLVVKDSSRYPGTKIAANERLLAACRSSLPSGEREIRYQCSSNREKVVYKQPKLDTNAVGIGKRRINLNYISSLPKQVSLYLACPKLVLIAIMTMN
jgi:hypothetical protein